MQARRTLSPGRKRIKKFLDRYGEQLCSVRYRYDEQRRKRFTTVELIVEESDWIPPITPVTEPILVGLRVALHETRIQRTIKQAGGTWNRQNQVWEILSDQALALGLADRIVNQRVSTNRHPQADSN